HALGQQKTLAASVLRHQRNAVPAGQRLARVADRSGLAPQLQPTACLGGAEQRLEQLALAVPLQAAHAEHLAFAQGETDAGHSASRAGNADVASSRMRIRGSLARPLAISTIWRSASVSRRSSWSGRSGGKSYFSSNASVARRNSARRTVRRGVNGSRRNHMF